MNNHVEQFNHDAELDRLRAENQRLRETLEWLRTNSPSVLQQKIIDEALEQKS